MTSLDEIADTIEAFPEVLDTLLRPFERDSLRSQPAMGEWSPLEVIGHLIVCDGPAFRDRIGLIVGGAATIPGFNPSLDLIDRDFRAADLSDLLDELRAERQRSAAFLRTLDPLDLRRTSELAPHGSFTAGDFVHEWPFHDQDHLQQILAAVKLRYLPFMSEPMQHALTGRPEPVEEEPISLDSLPLVSQQRVS